MAQPPSMTSESHWLLSAAGKWTEEDEKQWKRQQHRENMVHFRKKKKAQQAQLRALHRQLEQQLQQHLNGQRRALARASPVRQPNVDDMQNALQRLVLEREDLRTENLALREQIVRHERVYDLIGQEGASLAPGSDAGARKKAGSSDDRDGSNSDSSASASSYASSSPALGPSSSSGVLVDPSIGGYGGRRVFFESGAPSFHYQPFSKQQCDAIKLQYDVRFAARPIGEDVGTMLGWKVERAPLVRKPEMKNAIIARVWYTKRIRCSPGGVRAAVDNLAAASWPTLIEPALWSKIHTYSVESQVLQVMDPDTYILARNIPGPGAGPRFIRYLNLVQRGTEVNAFNQRVLTYNMVVATSPENSRSQAAEQDEGILWAPFGGAMMQLVEVDDEHFDVVYDHIACCLSEKHAQQQLVDWGSIAVRWEQLVLPSRMLCG